MGKGKRIVLLGSTGSIGRQTLDVIERLNRAGRKVEIAALGAGRNVGLLCEQIESVRPKAVSVARREDRDVIARRYPKLRVLHGEEGLVELASLEVDLVVNALVGAIGLPPTLAALERGRTVALANKESLVIGGDLVKRTIENNKGKLIPIDSEHSALLQGLSAGRHEEVKRLIITASGGPFLNTTLEGLERVSPDDALKHPKWRMGRRITIDSATMVNKGFEVIEAHHLFDISYDRIDVIIHPDSIVHSMVEFVDGSIIAQLAAHDMRIPIQYAITYPERLETDLPRLDLSDRLNLEFLPLDEKRFPAFSTVIAAGRAGGTATAAINAADEVLVRRFLAGEIPFTAIPEGLSSTLKSWENDAPFTLDGIRAADSWGRSFAEELFC